MGSGTRCFGFLTALEETDGSFVGGYLVLNPLGRPLEFQCTTPVRPNRPQRILYGPTLRPYVMGELIGQTLVNKADASPVLLITDEEHVLPLREHVATPLAQLRAADAARGAAGAGDGTGARCDESAPLSMCSASDLRVHPRYEGDRKQIERALRDLEVALDLAEPFQRIRDAINEALRPSSSR